MRENMFFHIFSRIKGFLIVLSENYFAGGVSLWYYCLRLIFQILTVFALLPLFTM